MLSDLIAAVGWLQGEASLDLKARQLAAENTIRKWQSRLSTPPGIVECWTVMERSTWLLLSSRGTLSCPADKADADPMFQQAYGWMKKSMAEAGLPAPALGLSPWWCWVKRGEGSSKPYIEDLAGLEDPVVLQLRVPANLMVLSCFDLWHFVLNRIYVYESVDDEAQFDQAISNAEDGSEAAWLMEQRLQNSWMAIFELDQLKVDMGPFESKSIQGCLWALERCYVTAVLEASDLGSHGDTDSHQKRRIQSELASVELADRP